jgi:hypothetical protein
MKALPVILAAAGALAALAATSPARADGRDHREWRGRPGWHGGGWHDGGWHGHAWRGPGYWHAYPRPYAYVAPPPVYYAPPPVYYAPPPPVFFGFSVW